jgi:outer membrane protein
MKRFVSLIILLAAAAAPLRGEADDTIRKGEQLNLKRCIEIALMKNPAIVAAKGTVNVNASRIGQAKSNYFPQVDGTANVSRTSVGPRRSLGFQSGSAIYNSYSAGVSLSQNIYDFGKTAAQVKIQKLNFDSSQSDLENVSEQVILAVKQDYYGVVQAKYNVRVAEDTVKQTQQHLEQAKGFYEVGTAPKFDVTKAEVDVSNAKLNLIKLENDYRISVVNLNNAMGTPSAPEYTLQENLSFGKYEITLEDALVKAYENRPDVKSAIAKRQAGERSIDLAKTGYYPFLTGNAGYNYAGNEFPLARGWNIGATFSFPIFSGFLTKHQVGEAEANLDVLKANEESLRQTVFLEVQQAYLTLRAAEEAIPTAKLGVDQAQENMDIANGRYAAGVGNPIEVTDAEVSLANARLAYIQALYADKVAQANLEKAMGTK